MTKINLLKQIVNDRVWDTFKEVYDVYSDEPQSDKQIEFLDKISNYIYEDFARKIKVVDLQLMKEENDRRKERAERLAERIAGNR